MIALWPAAGLSVLALIKYFMSRRGAPVLPAATGGSDVLLRMYLWPLVCWRIWKAAKEHQALPRDEAD